MSKSLYRIFVLLLAVFSMTLIFGACNPTDGATIKSISLKSGQVTEFAMSEFSLSKIYITVTDINDKVTERAISTDMLSEDDVLKLKSAGEHDIVVKYGNKEVAVTITITSDGGLNGPSGPNDTDYVVVSFNTNGGAPTLSDITGVDSVIINQIIAITKTNYTFGGWYTDAGFVNAITEFPFTVTNNVMLYAKWNPVEVKVTLDVLAADVSLSQTVYTTTAGSTVTGIPNNVARTGYKFTGWYTDSNCTVLVSTRQVYTRDTTLYAGWTPAEFKVYYNLGGGYYTSGANSYTDLYTQTYPYGQTVNKITPSRDLFNFAGWVDKNGDTYLFSTMPAEDVDLTAKWTIADPNTFFSYSVNIDGTYTITGYNDNSVASDTTEIEIPSLINQTKVTAIGANAFKGRKALTSVKIAEGIKYIYNNAFDGTSLKASSSSLPGTLEYVGANALPSTWVYDNTVGSNSTVYYQFNFINTAGGAILVKYNSGAAGVTQIPSGVFRIAPNAFKGSQDITIVNLPASVVYIDEGAFGNSALSELNIASGSLIREVSSTAFTGSEWLSEQESLGGFIVLGSLLYKYCGFSGVTTLTLPSVKYIAPDLFNGYTKLANISFANESLIEVIGAKAFYRTKWAESREFGVVNGILTSYYKKVGVSDNVQITVPSNVRTIGANAFEYVKGNVINIVLPASVTQLEKYAFTGFTKSNFKLTLLGDNPPVAYMESFARAANDSRLIRMEIYVKPGTAGNYLEESALNIWRLLPRLTYTYTESASGGYVKSSASSYIEYNSVLHSGMTRYARSINESVTYFERAVASIDSVSNLKTVYELGDTLVDVNGNTDLSLVVMTYTTNDGMTYYNQRVLPLYISGFSSLTSTVRTTAPDGVRTVTVTFGLPNSSVQKTFGVDYTVKRSIFNIEVYNDSLITEYFLNQSFSSANKNPAFPGEAAVLAVTYKIGTGSELDYEIFYVNVDSPGVLIGNFRTNEESSSSNILEMSIEYDGMVIEVPYTVSAMSVTGLEIREYIQKDNGDYVVQFTEDENGNYIKQYVYTEYDIANPEHEEVYKYVHFAEEVSYTLDEAGNYIKLYIPNTAGALVLVAHQLTADGEGAFIRLYAYTADDDGDYVYLSDKYVAYDASSHGGLQRYSRAEGDVYAAYQEGMEGVRYAAVPIDEPYYTDYNSLDPIHATYVRYSVSDAYTPYSEGMQGVRYQRTFVPSRYILYDASEHEGFTLYVRNVSDAAVPYRAGLNGVRVQLGYIPYDNGNPEHDGVARYDKNGLAVDGNLYAVMEQLDYDNYYITCIFDQLKEGSDSEYITRDIPLNGQIYEDSGYYLSVQNFSTDTARSGAVAVISYGDFEVSVTYTVEPRTEQKHFRLSIQGDNAVITGLNEGYPSTVYLPGTVTVDGVNYSVAGVAPDAFKGYENLITVYVDYSIGYIGQGAFRGSSIKEVYIGSGSALTEIADYTFADALNLVTVDFGADSAVSRIGKYAFSGAFTSSSAASIELPASVRVIDAYAFQESKLVSFSAAGGLTTLNAYAFYNSNRLSSVVLPSSVTSIGSASFMNCGALTSFRVPEGVTEILPLTFYNCDKLTEIYMNTSVTSIGKQAIANCERLTRVSGYSNANINLVDIGEEALSENAYLTTFSFNPATLKNIGAKAFRYDTRLAAVNLASANALLTIGSEAFSGTAITSIVIPASVVNMAADAFAYCTKVSSINILTANFTEVADYMFQGFTALTSVTLTEHVVRVGDYAFAQTSALSAITLPSGITSIGEGAFYESGIASIQFGGSLQTIGAYAFLDNTRLTTLTIPAAVTDIGEGAFMGCLSIASLNFAPGSVLADIGAKAFLGDKLITTLVLPVTITTIGASAFEKCFGLTALTIPVANRLTLIGDNAFRDCSKLADFNYGESLSTVESTVIGVSAFARCYALTSLSLPASVTSIGEKAFYNCTGLTKVSIGAGTVNTYTAANNAQLLDSAIIKYVLADNVWVVYNEANHSGLTRYIRKTVSVASRAVTLENYTAATPAQIADTSVQLYVRVNYQWVQYNRTGPDAAHINLKQYVYTPDAQEVFYGDFVRSKLTAMGRYAFGNTTSLTELYATIENPYAMYGRYVGTNASASNAAARHFGYLADGVFISHFTNSEFDLHIAMNTANNNDTDRYTSWSENKNVLNIDIYLTIDPMYIA